MQSAMAELAEAMTLDSPEGTKAMVTGVSDAPSLPAAGAVMASGNGSQMGGMGVGTAVGAVVAVGGMAVGGCVAVGAGGWVAVGAGGCVTTGAAVVAAGPQAVSSMITATRMDTNRVVFFIYLSSHEMKIDGDFSSQ